MIEWMREMFMNEALYEVREAIADRLDGFCPWCGLRLQGDFAIHHRLLRKHGGDNSPSNLLALHHGCHNLKTRSVHLMPELSYQRGFLVHSWEQPHRTPLRIHGGEWVLLNNDRTVTHQRKEEDLHDW